MNNVVLKGVIRDIRFSHELNGIVYNTADVVIPNTHGKEDDIIPIKYRASSQVYADGQQIELTGNIRSFSRSEGNGKNSVHIYVYTYFDIPECLEANSIEVDGRICKIGELQKTNNGDYIIHFILANNIYTEYKGKKINSYIPCTAFSKNASDISHFGINTKLQILGKIHSRTYKKTLQNGEIEYRTAHEVVIDKFQEIE